MYYYLCPNFTYQKSSRLNWVDKIVTKIYAVEPLNMAKGLWSNFWQPIVRDIQNLRKIQ